MKLKHLLLALAALACSRATEPLAEQRATCEQLSSQKALRAGLTVEESAVPPRRPRWPR